MSRNINKSHLTWLHVHHAIFAYQILRWTWSSTFIRGDWPPTLTLHADILTRTSC